MIEPCGKHYQTTKLLIHGSTVVPIGFKTNGISYKYRLIGIFINRFDPRYIKAVIFHDYLTEQGEWGEGNKIFEELLPNDMISKIMVIGVKLYRDTIIRK